jgi:hypothetical protein
MSIKTHCLPGMHLGYTETYAAQKGVLRGTTRWMKCERVDWATGAVIGHNLHTGEEVKVHIDLIHTSNSPFQQV